MYLDIAYNDIISPENLLEAWQEFIRGKKNRKDVEEFQRHLMHNIISLHEALASKAYRHSAYEAFTVSDPKTRNIHKSKVRDRLLHHAIYRKLYPYFDRRFIHDSYSCRTGKGTHRALGQFKAYASKASLNDTRTLWILKCDVRKFFASIDQPILHAILKRSIRNADVLWLLESVITSFYSTGEGKGLPLGNLTSQLLVNIYMNEFDQFVKRDLRARHYIRYADDFVLMDTDKGRLELMLLKIGDFLAQNLKLSLHPDKVFIKTLASGVDFLGWVHFPGHRTLRTASKRRMLRNLRANKSDASVQSYKGLLSHGNARGLAGQIDLLLNDERGA